MRICPFFCSGCMKVIAVPLVKVKTNPSPQEQMISDHEGDPTSASNNSDMECEDNTTIGMESQSQKKKIRMVIYIC